MTILILAQNALIMLGRQYGIFLTSLKIQHHFKGVSNFSKFSTWLFVRMENPKLKRNFLFFMIILSFIQNCSSKSLNKNKKKQGWVGGGRTVGDFALGLTYEQYYYLSNNI